MPTYWSQNTSEKWAMAEPHEFFTEIKLASHLFMGLTDNIMSHSEGWHFCQLGRLIERADKTSRIVDVKYFILLPSIWDVDTPFGRHSVGGTVTFCQWF